MRGTRLTMPTSAQENAVPVAEPPAKAPNVPLMLDASPLVGNTRTVARRTDSAGDSLPKLGVALPPLSTARTVAVNGWPAGMNTVPDAVLAAGFAKPVLVRLIFDTRKLAGRETYVPVLPRMPVGKLVFPVVASFMDTLRLPASL